MWRTQKSLWLELCGLRWIIDSWYNREWVGICLGYCFCHIRIFSNMSQHSDPEPDVWALMWVESVDLGGTFRKNCKWCHRSHEVVQFVEWWGYSNSLGFPRVGESVWHFSRSICLTTFLPVPFLICPDICTSCLVVCLCIGLSVYCVLEAAAIRIPTVTRADPALIKKTLRNHNISADFVYLIYLINTISVTLLFYWCM